MAKKAPEQGPNPAPKARSEKQLTRVRQLMLDGKWRTYSEIKLELGGKYPEQSISARLRDLRKDQFGAFDVDKRPRRGAAKGLIEYRLLAVTDDDDGAKKEGSCKCPICGYRHKKVQKKAS